MNRETTHKKLFLSFTCYIIFDISVSMTKNHPDNVYLYWRNSPFFNYFITLDGGEVIKEGRRTWTASRRFPRSQLLGLQNITGKKDNEGNGMKDHLRATT